MRLDIFLFHNKFTQSRNKAIELIKNGFIKLNNEIILKPSFNVDSTLKNNIEILKKDIFVSRAGEKLDSYIRDNNIIFNGLDILDIGSSKGGFAQVLLKYGANSVTCVDIGCNQLDKALRDDSRIKLFESCDIKDFHTNKKFDFIVCDVSFISLKCIIEHIYTLASNEILLLFKPQFEVGKNIKRNKKGVVIDKNAINNSLNLFISYLKNNGFIIKNIEASKFKGKEGNEEIFINIKKK
ncbi:TlyA family RNA methyltransferase [Helicobacter sp. MIT 14-3879]|uniref:23S rRNA (cytidine-2'-O)-methyltransferase TlyA n=1 Tax=Helicobacter sp. MIT 14-3879 TaxID=2040649 RepID=UPI000E1EF071|nr:TlyA family RNA methyltransferase [Helicobacter sp. MIT 14-3879]RDU63540.1 TlyA family rRNA (cytidine-2'-O)-methyltransferase [Helicobacter sp. MIT 14-3879]